jgi:hypothetical protein
MLDKSRKPTEETRVPKQNAVVAVYASHVEAEKAPEKLQIGGIDMRALSIVGKGYLPGNRLKGIDRWICLPCHSRDWATARSVTSGFGDCSGIGTVVVGSLSAFIRQGGLSIGFPVRAALHK